MQVNKQGTIHVPPTPAALQVGNKKLLPDHVPPHCPPFPDPHTFIKTPAYKKPQSDYKVLRDKGAMYKRNAEQALSKFSTRTRKSLPLTSTGILSSVLMVLPEEDPQPYRNALLSAREEGPKPVLDESSDDTEGKDQTNSENPERHSIPVSNVAVGLGHNDHSSEQKDWISNPYFQQPKKPKTIFDN
jgi:hypothetical protein